MSKGPRSRRRGRQPFTPKPGKSFVAKGAVTFVCPFCVGGKVVYVREPMSVMHTMPMCEKFDKLDPLVFIREARLAVFGPKPDDGEWPLVVPEGKGDN